MPYLRPRANNKKPDITGGHIVINKLQGIPVACLGLYTMSFKH